MTKEKTIYDLKLHESIFVRKGNGYFILETECIRVPGGWIYNSIAPRSGHDNYTGFSCFVPYHEEFKDG